MQQPQMILPSGLAMNERFALAAVRQRGTTEISAQKRGLGTDGRVQLGHTD